MTWPALSWGRLFLSGWRQTLSLTDSWRRAGCTVPGASGAAVLVRASRSPGRSLPPLRIGLSAGFSPLEAGFSFVPATLVEPRLLVTRNQFRDRARAGPLRGPASSGRSVIRVCAIVLDLKSTMWRYSAMVTVSLLALALVGLAALLMLIDSRGSR